MAELKAPSLQSLLESDRGSTDSLQLDFEFEDVSETTTKRKDLVYIYVFIPCPAG